MPALIHFQIWKWGLLHVEGPISTGPLPMTEEVLSLPKMHSRHSIALDSAKLLVAHCAQGQCGCREKYRLST